MAKSNPLNDIRRRRRYGTATVEAALIFPLIVAVFLGMIEMGRGIMVLHTLQEASQAGCRVYSVEGTTRAQAEAIISTTMQAAGLADYQVEFHPATKDGIIRTLQPVTVSVTAPFNKTAWLAPTFMPDAQLEGKCVMPADIVSSDGGDDNGYAAVNDDHTDDGVARVDDAPPAD